MGRLRLQMQASIDGMVATQRDHARFNRDEEVRQYSITHAANVDCHLLGRKTATGFIPHWKSAAANPKDADFAFGKMVTDIPKAIFSRSLGKSKWPNATVADGEIVDCVNQLKKQAGKDEDAVGCAMFKHGHFEVAVPDSKMSIDEGGFLTDNAGGKRERNPRFRNVPDQLLTKGAQYRAGQC